MQSLPSGWGNHQICSHYHQIAIIFLHISNSCVLFLVKVFLLDFGSRFGSKQNFQKASSLVSTVRWSWCLLSISLHQTYRCYLRCLLHSTVFLAREPLCHHIPHAFSTAQYRDCIARSQPGMMVFHHCRIHYQPHHQIQQHNGPALPQHDHTLVVAHIHARFWTLCAKLFKENFKFIWILDDDLLVQMQHMFQDTNVEMWWLWNAVFSNNCVQSCIMVASNLLSMFHWGTHIGYPLGYPYMLIKATTVLYYRLLTGHQCQPLHWVIEATSSLRNVNDIFSHILHTLTWQCHICRWAVIICCIPFSKHLPTALLAWWAQFRTWVKLPED